MLKILSFFAYALWADSFVPYIGPYLQMPSPNEIVVSLESKYPVLELVWKEANSGTRDILRNQGIPFRASKLKGLYLHKFSLKNFAPDTKIHYWLRAENKVSKVYKHHTLSQTKENFSLVLMSDAQHGYKVTKKQIRESVAKHLFSKNPVTDYPVRMTLFAGDLVQEGDEYHRWKKEFFGPMSLLNEKVVLFPAIGNHEKDHTYYYKYFDLPQNGSESYKEHWYTVDYQNVRIISLDTNKGYRIQEQLNWLEGVLSEAEEKKFDFVLAEFHHPYQSELWVPGNTKYSGLIQSRLEEFSKKTKIPSFTIFGHTHGYSRGHSFKANHSMLNVASIGGAIDDWGDYLQKDYPEYLISMDNFGWVLAEVEQGENPQIRFKRFSFGNDSHQEDEGVVDQFVIKRFNKKPIAPEILGFQQMKTFPTYYNAEIRLSEFMDEDSDTHLSTHIQVSWDPSFQKGVKNIYQNSINLYFNEDKNAQKSLVAPIIRIKKSKNPQYIRARFRDSSLGWSQFSKVFRK